MAITTQTSNTSNRTNDDKGEALSSRYSYASTARDEMNLAEFPLAVLSTRSNSSVKTLEFCDKATREGELIERKWIITGADKFGLPTSTDDDVVLGLICLTKEQGFRNRKVYFTRYELLKILRWTTEGRSYARLTKSLDRLSGVRIRASNSFFDNSLKAYQTKNFGIVDAYEINDERASSTNPNSYFVWSEEMFNSFQSGFIKKIDLNYYFSLKSAVSRRLYRYLDKHYYFKNVVEKPLQILAFEKLGLSRTYKYVSSIRQQLDPACEELVSTGFLSSVDYVGKGEGTVVRFFKGKDDAAALPTPVTQNVRVEEKTENKKDFVKLKHDENPLETEQLDELSAELIKRGLTTGQIKKIMLNKSETERTRIRQILDYYDRLVKSGDAKLPKNPIGFLYSAVEKPFKFTVPEEYSKPAATSADTNKRPELRVVRASKVKESQDMALRQSYQNYFDTMVSASIQRMDATKLGAIRTSVEQRMSNLRSVLRGKYGEAVDGLVKQEVAKLAGVPTFEEWLVRASS